MIWFHLRNKFAQVLCLKYLKPCLNFQKLRYLPMNRKPWTKLTTNQRRYSLGRLRLIQTSKTWMMIKVSSLINKIKKWWTRICHSTPQFSIECWSRYWTTRRILNLRKEVLGKELTVMIKCWKVSSKNKMLVHSAKQKSNIKPKPNRREDR